MRIRVNLASKPFVELRPFFLRLRIIMAALAVVALGLLIGIHFLNAKLAVARIQMDRLQAATQKAQQEKTDNERKMHQPENSAVLTRAHFLNALFLRKSFSWTAVMMDLETVLPSGVQITAIEPQIASDGDVTIRLRVGGDRDRAIQLVRNLERSKRFLSPQLTTESPAAKDTGVQGRAPVNNGAPTGVEFEILARYNPLPEDEIYTTAKPAKAATDSTAPGHAARKPGKPAAPTTAPKAATPKATTQKATTQKAKGVTR
jgi:type IV pilus assembly protein PilN